MLLKCWQVKSSLINGDIRGLIEAVVSATKQLCCYLDVIENQFDPSETEQKQKGFPVSWCLGTIIHVGHFDEVSSKLAGLTRRGTL